MRFPYPEILTWAIVNAFLFYLIKNNLSLYVFISGWALVAIVLIFGLYRSIKNSAKDELD